MASGTRDPAVNAADILAALDESRPFAPLTSRVPEFDEHAAYAVTAEMRALRMARGEAPVGRKIGFTNRNIWPEYGIYQPIWGDVYDTTMREVADGERIAASHLPEPRIEPEIVLGLDRDVDASMSTAEVEACIGWVAHGFEIVQSVYPGWRFKVADCIADGGLHGALYVGPRRLLAPAERAGLATALSGLSITLSRNGEPADTGSGSNVLDGPIQALRHLAGVLARDPGNPGLQKGELVTTGTLTRAFPIAVGERWSTRIEGYPLPGLSVEIA
jgi:2-oxo-3-hexenedioate decarboxylase